MLRTMPDHGRHSAPQEFDQARPGAGRQKGIAFEGEEAKGRNAPQNFARIAPESPQAVLKEYPRENRREASEAKSGEKSEAKKAWPWRAQGGPGKFGQGKSVAAQLPRPAVAPSGGAAPRRRG